MEEFYAMVEAFKVYRNACIVMENFGGAYALYNDYIQLGGTKGRELAESLDVDVELKYREGDTRYPCEYWFIYDGIRFLWLE